MGFVESPGVRVPLVDVDLERLGPAILRQRDGPLKQGVADAATADVRPNVQLFEKDHGTRIPDTGPEGEQRDAGGGIACQQGDDVVAAQHSTKTLCENRGARRGGVELQVEIVQQPSDDIRVVDVRDTDVERM